MLLVRGPSWPQGSGPQPINEAQDLGEQCSRYGDLFELDCDGAAMTYDLGTDLDRFLPERRQRDDEAPIRGLEINPIIGQ